MLADAQHGDCKKPSCESLLMTIIQDKTCNLSSSKQIEEVSCNLQELLTKCLINAPSHSALVATHYSG